MNDKLQEIVKCLNKDKLVIITGIKNSGKSKIIKLLLKKIGKENNSFYFDKINDIKNEIQKSSNLESLLNNYIKLNNKPSIIILKNISKIEKIKDFIGNIYSNGYKIIIIGNNIKIGGIKEIEILPQFNITNLKDNIKYGFCNNVNLINNQSFKEKYIDLLKTDIITNSIFKDLGIKSIDLYNYTISYIAFNNKFNSLRELQKIINNNQTISLKTLIDYIDYSIQAKIIKKMYNFDLKNNKQISSKAKYYFTDNGIRNSLTNFNLEQNILIENLIYINLLQKGYTVYGGINGKFEFSFYGEKENPHPPSGTSTLQEEEKINIYIHISKESEKEKIKKEVRKLNKIGNSFKKYLIVNNIEKLGIKKVIFNEVEIVELDEFIKNNINYC